MVVRDLRELSPVALRGAHEEEVGSELEKPGLEPGTFLWDAGFASGILTTAPNTHPIALP